jgi:Domain of unknown function (DUF4272)
MDSLSPVRKRNLARLKRLGFKVAPSLPLRDAGRELRSPLEIASRLMALDAVSCWVVEPAGMTASEKLKGYVARGGFGKWMTRSEKAIFKLPRAKANHQHVDTIGWRFENMWPLAWALGFGAEPAVDGEEIATKTVRAIVLKFLPGLRFGPADLAAKARPRSVGAVVAIEDLFYCAHNAVRSAQLGGKTVPKGFHPVANGGVIHERRHALSWCLSDEGWDDVDLST